MDKIYKLSPSDLTFLWDECKRCFYLKVVHNFRRPFAPFPSIFNRIDKLMKDFFNGMSVKEITIELPDGKIILGEKWVSSEVIEFNNRNASCFIRGKFDTVVQFTNKSYGVIDFKTSQAKPEHVDFYARQLRAYAYALEHPAENSLYLSPISHLGLLTVEPIRMDKPNESQIAYIGNVTWQEIPVDEIGFLKFIDEILSVLESPEPPEANPQCSYCDYRYSSRELNY